MSVTKMYLYAVAKKFVFLYETDRDVAAKFIIASGIKETEFSQLRPLIQKEFIKRGWKFENV